MQVLLAIILQNKNNILVPNNEEGNETLWNFKHTELHLIFQHSYNLKNTVEPEILFKGT